MTSLRTTDPVTPPAQGLRRQIPAQLLLGGPQVGELDDRIGGSSWRRLYRIKSNALYGLALGEVADMGWASFSGKATYRDPSMLEPEGNHEFIMYVEDHGEPGAGSDRVWIETHDKDGAVIPAMSMDREAGDNAVEISGGNIVVPHSGGGRVK